MELNKIIIFKHVEQMFQLWNMYMDLNSRYI
jgi:hypothetical protein